MKNAALVKQFVPVGLGIALLTVALASLPTNDAALAQAAVTPTAASPANLFQYDDKTALNIKEVGTEKRGDVTVRDITFVGVKDPIKAYLVTPSGSGPFAGILYVHWLGDPPTTNRTEFLEEAVALASKGVVSLLVDTMWAQSGWYKSRVPEKDFESSVQQVIELRRAMDVLLSQPDIDSERIGFVGHDFGAMYGVLMGAVDPRPATYVLMAGTPSFIDWFLYAAQPKSLADYKKQMAVLDPTNFVNQIMVPVFFQFARGDQYVPADAATRFYNAANPRKQMATYTTSHGMEAPEVAADRILWLTRELGLK